MIKHMKKFLAFITRWIPVRGRWRLVPYIVGNPRDEELYTVYVPRIGKMILDVSSYLEADIFVVGFHSDEYLVTEALHDLLQVNQGVFIDVGANIGFHTIFASKILAPKGGVVYAFEPFESNYERLNNNLHLNKISNCTIEQFGLYNEEKTVEICIGGLGTGNVSLASQGQYKQDIHLIRFDDYVTSNNIKKIDVIKMDIEGAELMALQGMVSAIEKFQPVIILEINPMWTKRMDTSTTELIEYLHSLDYKIFPLQENRHQAPSEIMHVDPNGTREVNAIALPAHRR